MEHVHQLVRRLIEARAKGHLEGLLRTAKARVGGKAKLCVQGTEEELVSAVTGAMIDKALEPAELAGLVDQIEEWGAQHIFLYDLTEERRKTLTPPFVRDAFPRTPETPTLAHMPTNHRSALS